MSALGTIFDVVGGICTAGGAVMLMNQAYQSLTTRRAPGKVVAWASEQDGSNVRYRAQLAYTTPDGAQHTGETTSLAFDTDRDARPPGTKVTVRYSQAEPGAVDIADGFFGTWGVPLIGVAIGVAGFAIGTVLH